MVKIRVKYGGCGIRYTDENGVSRHALKTPESGPFDCDEAKAAQLVGMGMAEYVGTVEAVEEPAAPDPEGQQVEPDTQQEASGEQDEDPGEPSQEAEETTCPVKVNVETPPQKFSYHLDEEQLNDMTIKQLKALAADMGVDVSDCDRKADYVAALAAADVELDDVDDPDNELPELTAADPE